MTALSKLAPRSRPLKLLLGCALLLGLLGFGACVIAGSIGVYFMTTPKQAKLEALIGEGSLGAVAVHADLEDPGVKGVIDAFFDIFERAQGRASAGLPAPLRAMQSLGRGQNRRNLAWLFPIEGVLVFDEITSLDPLALSFTGGINLDHLPRAYARSLEWISKLDTGGRNTFVEHGEHTILAGRDGAAFCLAGGTLLLGTDLPQMIRSLDRLDATAPSEPPVLLGELAALRGPGDLEFVLRLDAPEVQDFVLSSLRQGMPEGIAAACTRLAGWVDLVDADTLHLQAKLRCLEDLAGTATWLEPLVAQARQRLEEEGFTAEIEVRMLEGEAKGLDIDLRLQGLKAKLVRAIEEPKTLVVPSPAP